MEKYKTVRELIAACDREYERIGNFLKDVRKFVSNLENELLISDAELIAARHSG